MNFVDLLYSAGVLIFIFVGWQITTALWEINLTLKEFLKRM